METVDDDESDRRKRGKFLFEAPTSKRPRVPGRDSTSSRANKRQTPEEAEIEGEEEVSAIRCYSG